MVGIVSDSIYTTQSQITLEARGAMAHPRLAPHRARVAGPRCCVASTQFPVVIQSIRSRNAQAAKLSSDGGAVVYLSSSCPSMYCTLSLSQDIRVSDDSHMLAHPLIQLASLQGQRSFIRFHMPLSFLVHGLSYHLQFLDFPSCSWIDINREASRHLSAPSVFL